MLSNISKQILITAITFELLPHSREFGVQCSLGSYKLKKIFQEISSEFSPYFQTRKKLNFQLNDCCCVT